ncbi:MAG: ABC transporter ATP-binding protein [Bauldia sp.]|uniref:ABC transporter ATP-binding protein n=1 Tax=Bauldia sp. TaxID=2575872 RepID=UPI001D4C2C02|nr:ABC transporter ATP-binding protein [Bauldia sp.]MCB1497829.1 ABC transporter ATP-binding protein [Bauldia sp.]
MTALLEIRGLVVGYGDAPPVLGPIDLDMRAGELVGLVGESGGGKSTLSRAVLNDLPAGANILEGNIALNGVPLYPVQPQAWRAIRWKQIAYVPQAALNILNPVRRIGAQFGDMVADHYGVALAGEWMQKVIDVLTAVRLEPAVLRCYPHQLSGGMRQRVCIAMAMLFQPQLVVADEPTSALDVVSQRLVLQTLLELRDKFGTAILLVGHDLAVMAQVADRIGILFAGQLVEYGPARAIFKEPAHPYARRLLQAVPSIRVRSDLPEATFPSEADRQHWSDRSIPMRLVGPNHQARCETQ